MKSVEIAILLMVIATVAVHLGLPQTIAQIGAKVMRCHKCLTFWLTLFAMLIIGERLTTAVLLSLAGAYLSNWFALLLVELQKLYNWLWERLNK